MKEFFIKSEKVEDILNLGLATKKGVLLYGPPGHGKSEMIRTFLSFHYNKEDVFIQSFGEGMSEDRLYGGLNFQKFNEEGILEFYPENSFLNKKAVVFEEIFDAPPAVLLSLKDTITSKQLNNGNQVFPMETETLIAATNKHPDEIAQMGDAYAALVERFPLQLEVKWDCYNYYAYRDLLKKVRPGADIDLVKSISKIIENISEKELVSPRKAVHAIDVMLSIEKEQGEICANDFAYLGYIPGFTKYADGLKDEILLHKEKEQSKGKIDCFKRKLDGFENYEDIQSPIKLLKMAKTLAKEAKNFKNEKIHESHLEDRENYLNTASKLIADLKEQALEKTIL